MSKRSPKQLVTVRLRPEVAARTLGEGRTALIEKLLDAYHDRRLIISSEPISSKNDGSNPEHPVFVCFKSGERA